MTRFAVPGARTWPTLYLLLMLPWALSGCVTTVEGDSQTAASTEQRVQAQLALARGYIEAGDWQSARSTLERAMDIDSRSSEVHGWFALVYEAEGEPDHAERYYRRALRLDRNNAQVLNNFGNFLYQQQRYREARQILLRVAEDTGYRARPHALENLGVTELQLGDVEAAEEAFRRALVLEPELAVSHLELARIAFERGNNAEARRHYMAFRRLSEQSPRSLWLGIQLYRALDDMDMVASFALQLRNMYPGSDEYATYQGKFE